MIITKLTSFFSYTSVGLSLGVNGGSLGLNKVDLGMNRGRFEGNICSRYCCI